jgi:hypothetical protein
MSMKLVIEENGKRTEIDYDELSGPEIRSRLRAYEKKYGPYPRYMKTYSCSDSTPDETTDVMDWECLLEEKKRRNANK